MELYYNIAMDKQVTGVENPEWPCCYQTHSVQGDIIYVHMTGDL